MRPAGNLARALKIREERERAQTDPQSSRARRRTDASTDAPAPATFCLDDATPAAAGSDRELMQAALVHGAAETLARAEAEEVLARVIEERDHSHRLALQLQEHNARLSESAGKAIEQRDAARERCRAAEERAARLEEARAAGCRDASTSPDNELLAASNVASLMHDLEARSRGPDAGEVFQAGGETKGARRQRVADALRARATLGRYLLRWYRATML